MDERTKAEQNTQIKRDTEVRGSLGVPPSGAPDEDDSRMREDISDTRQPDRTRSRVVEDDDRMSER
jgi:hypothetical protein